MVSTNQTGPLWVIFRKRNRGEKHSISNRRRSAVAAKCSRFGCALKQNHTGSATSAGEADDCVTLQLRNWLSCACSQVLPNCLTVCHPVRTGGAPGVPDACPSSSSSDSHVTRRSGKFVTTDHDGRPPSHWDSPRRVALATTFVRLTMFKIQTHFPSDFLKFSWRSPA
jgi:hypothetical protein